MLLGQEWWIIGPKALVEEVGRGGSVGSPKPPWGRS